MSSRGAGPEWLGRLPHGWSHSPLRHAATVRNSNVDKKAYEGGVPIRLCNYTDVYYREFITADLDLMEATASRSEIERFELRQGDVIITKDSESWTDIAVPACVDSDLPGVVCGYHLTLLRPHSHIDGRFLLRAIQADGVREQFWVAANGVTRFGLGQQGMKGVVLPVPPLPIQRAIAAFLDRKTATIDDLIDKKERLIKLLAEKRAALIHRAVTKGLDDGVEMKDSGVEWIGEIPAHWEVMQLRRLVITLDQGWSPSALDRQKEFGEWGVLKLSSVRFGRYFPKKHKALPSDLEPRPEFVPRPGDLLVARANTPELVGDSCVVGEFDPSLMLCDLLYRLRLDLNRASPEFVDFFLRSAPGRAMRTTDARGSSLSMVKLSQSHVRAWTIPVPPVAEQARIVRHLGFKEAGLWRVNRQIRDQIDMLREYRQALITAAVTGQIEVPAEYAR